MKKNVIITLILTILIFLGYKFIKFVEGIETPDLEYNTVYSDKYEEKLFNNSLLGQTKKQIIDKLGKPLVTESINPYSKFLYRDKNDSIYINCSGGVDLSSYNIINKNYSFLTFEFDENNNVIEVFQVIDSEKVDADSLIGISKNEIINKFGKPTQIAQINFKGNMLAFSNLKEGAYTGKTPKIHVRNIVFDKNEKAIKIVKADGYGFLEGLCEIINN
ncbi:hypothetical protein [Epilithonimonas hominis]|uniref:Uncharacterized protein n=1 Tax=Epilithonimonas hominis TaxID=420404 RepID=A0A3N0X474_9FLAO|nr:hypothetical protein [Epilithonimonas hominis]ROI12186.1 hypothetical protein EGH73_12160 [Epilithonimonas hominis]